MILCRHFFFLHPSYFYRNFFFPIPFNQYNFLLYYRNIFFLYFLSLHTLSFIYLPSLLYICLLFPYSLTLLSETLIIFPSLFLIFSFSLLFDAEIWIHAILPLSVIFRFSFFFLTLLSASLELESLYIIDSFSVDLHSLIKQSIRPNRDWKLAKIWMKEENKDEKKT